MGIVNVTPDSFSDGGQFLRAEAAIAHGLRLAGEGAEILDVGGESTRPGAEPVSAAGGARARAARGRRSRRAHGSARAPQISIDTSKALVAEAALQAGASLVNDVTALRGDVRMATVIAAYDADCCLMHMQGEPRTMQSEPSYLDVVAEVGAFLAERLEHALAEGIKRERIMLDPGIGFGKSEAHNLELLDRLEELCALGAPIVIGTSRKAFIGRILARAVGHEEPVDVGERLAGTIATNVLAYERGASVFRVHDVAPVRDALAVAAATLGGRWTARSLGRTPMS